MASGNIVASRTLKPTRASSAKRTGMPNRVFSTWTRCSSLARRAVSRGGMRIEHKPAVTIPQPVSGGVRVSTIAPKGETSCAAFSAAVMRPRRSAMRSTTGREASR